MKTNVKLKVVICVWPQWPFPQKKEDKELFFFTVISTDDIIAWVFFSTMNHCECISAAKWIINQSNDVRSISNISSHDKNWSNINILTSHNFHVQRYFLHFLFPSLKRKKNTLQKVASIDRNRYNRSILVCWNIFNWPLNWKNADLLAR